VGRYFSEFHDSHYVANEELQTRYPEDMAETLGTVRDLYHRLTPSSGQASEQQESPKGTGCSSQDQKSQENQEAMPM
jgi:hypothetical protein